MATNEAQSDAVASKALSTEDAKAFGAAVAKNAAAAKGSDLAKAAEKCAKDGNSANAKALAELVVKDPAITRQAVVSGGGCEIYNTAEALLK